MRLAFLVPPAFLWLASEAALWSSSLRASRSSASSTAAYKACSCDCCLVQQEYHATSSNGRNALGCAPRSGALAPGGAAGTGDGGCADICMLPEDMRTAFKSESGEADYTRYCTEKCGPASTTLNDLCVDLADFDEGDQPSGSNQTREATARPSQKENAMTQVSVEVSDQSASSNQQAVVMLAKQQMEEARLQAEAAGRAAYSSRMAYERLKRTTDELAQKASEETLKEIKAEAAQQSKIAKEARLAYVNNAKATAIKNAQAAAKVYSKAEVRDQGLANVWQERAGQFATAASQREQMAMGFSSEAEMYRNRGQFDLAKQRMMMAHQAIDQAASFGAQSEAAHKQGQAIADSRPWYEYAKKAIAANVLAKSMPPDVPPPPLPALS